jgi:hypothetical protein
MTRAIDYLALSIGCAAIAFSISSTIASDLIAIIAYVNALL